MFSKNLDGVRERLSSELKRVGPEQVAEQAGVSLATVYNWMKGANTPLNKFMQLELAGVDVAFVITGQRGSQPMPSPAISEGDRTLLDNFHADPAQVQAGVKTTLEAFEPAAAGKRKPKAA